VSEPTDPERAAQEESEFAARLSSFSSEAELPGRFLYADLTMNAMAIENAQIHRALDRDADFWAVASNALHTAMFISLHRLFDSSSQDNADALLALGEERVWIFSRAALAARRARRSQDPSHAWVEDAHEATVDDFRRLRGEVRQRRNIYDLKYRAIRGKVLGHKILSDAETRQRYAATRKDELQEICSFFPALSSALWHLYDNGSSPEVKSQALSVEEIRAGAVAPGVQRLVVKHTERAMRSLVSEVGRSGDVE
jgi:hypothetical protein